MTTDGNQYSFTRSYQSFKHESIFTSFIIRSWSAWTGLVKYPDQPAQWLLARGAPLPILVRAYLHKGKGDSLVVLLRMKQKLMNIDCRLLKSCAAMTAQWGLHGTYAADHCRTSAGCVLMADFVNCFMMSGRSGGMLICWEQYMGTSSPTPGILRVKVWKRNGVRAQIRLGRCNFV